MRRIVSVAAVLCLSSFLSTARGVTFTETFDGPTIDPSLTVVSCTPGFTFALDSGKGVLKKLSGTGNGQLIVETDFALVGDFTALVTVHREDLSGIGTAGVATFIRSFGGGNPYNDVFFVGSATINSNIYGPPNFGFETTSDSSLEVTFRIRRVGSTLFEEFDAGSGFQTLHSATHTNLAAPFKLGVFMTQEFGNTNAHSATFDNLTITADAFLAPSDQCKNPGKSLLLLKNKMDDENDGLVWKWLKGSMTSEDDLGDPLVDATYTLCISDANGAFASFVVPPNSLWEDKEAKGFNYKDKPGTNDGIQKALLKTGATGKAKVLFKGKGVNLQMPDVSTLQAPVRVRLLNSTGVCWDSDFPAALKETGELWKAKQ